MLTPAGAFVFGNDEGAENERPARRIVLAGFRINRYEITNRQYRAFVSASGHRPSLYDTHPVLGRARYPVVGVSWDDASAFCAHYGLKLPLERQWERAARGTGGGLYPWGNAPVTPERANRGAAECCRPSEADGYRMTAPVGSFPAGRSPEGVDDLIGNAFEWVDGWYTPYDAQADAPRPEFRVLRGGAWNSDDWKLRATYRLAYRGEFRFAANGGFRCARD